MKKLLLSALLLMGFAATAQEPVKDTEVQKTNTADIRRFVSSQSVVTTTTTTRHGYRKKRPATTVNDTTATPQVDMAEVKMDTVKTKRILNYSTF